MCGIIAVLLLSVAPVQAVTPCGGEGERACCLLEGTNCESGLKEVATLIPNCAAATGNGLAMLFSATRGTPSIPLFLFIAPRVEAKANLNV